MRDTHRSKCYHAEEALGTQTQEPWNALMDLACCVCADPVVTAAYPALTRRPLCLRPVMTYRKGFIGRYDPMPHRILLAWGGRSKLVLLHELAHAACPGERHGPQWRHAFIFMAYRHLGPDSAAYLAASFINNKLVESERSL